MAQDRWYAPAVPFVAGAVAAGTVAFTAPLSRSTILLQTAGREPTPNERFGARVQASQYLRHVSTTEGLGASGKGMG